MGSAGIGKASRSLVCSTLNRMASWKESKAQKFAPLVATILLVVSEAITYKFPSERQIETQTTLTVIKSSVGVWFGWFAIIFWGACMVCSLMSIATRNKWGWLSFLAFLVCPCVGLSSGLEEMDHTYVDEGSSKDVDGSEYHLLTNSFLQGHKCLLAKVKDRAGSTTTYAILSFASFSGDAEHVRLVRTQGKPEVHAPTITRGRLLIAAFETYAYGAYDLNHKVNHSGSSDDKGYPISKLSPFVLLGPNDIPNQTDFEEALKEDAFNVTDPDVLKSELQNSNPRVREMAKIWLAKLAAKASAKP